MSEFKTGERLRNLVESGICPAESSTKYAEELKKLAHEVLGDSPISVSSRFFKALADETRLKVLKLLRIREMCVCEIMVALDLTQPTASHHLGILENIGLVKGRKRGKWVFYSIANPNLVESMCKLGIL